MYDAVTADLVRSSPALPGLEMATLPDRFTETFAHIVAARIRLREFSHELPDDVSSLVSHMRHIAYTNEALLFTLSDREDCVSAAFVAGTAHQLAANAERQILRGGPTTALSSSHVSSDIAAMLLFLVAEAPADAAEMARTLRTDLPDPVERALVMALRDFADGRWWAILNRPEPPKNGASTDVSYSGATRALYRLVLRGVRALAHQVSEPESDLTTSPVALLEHARSLSVAPFRLSDLDVRSPVSAVPGPHHLASLLQSVARRIGESSVSRIAPIPGLDDTAWVDSLRRIARSRPLLWRNHRAAIDEGLLRAGVSAVIAFPTGAGKSTLAELKINAALLAGHRVLFLAPTNALVDQVARNLRDSFPTFTIQGRRDDDFALETGPGLVPQLLVMTPEACLTHLSIDETVFQDVQLLIFDECHLIHPSKHGRNRRAVDAMLCLLSFVRICPLADLILMSAMIGNAAALANWIQELTGRQCLALDLPWKPTRQLRGSVVYGQEGVSAMERTLRADRSKASTRSPSAAVKRELTIRPLAFFSLKQTWATQQAEDYSLVPLLDRPVSLSANSYWKLVPNAVAVTAEIAAAAAAGGLKTLAFFQTIQNAASASRRIGASLGLANIEPTDEERSWFKTAALEFGGEEHLYMPVDDGRFTTYAGVHHGLLLSEERRLCESLYKRHDGLKVLVATSTVAQGINFPCELVIIGEDSRFDTEIESRDVLEAQELLNAAGRAGRAGQSSAGIVLVVPGRVVGIDLNQGTIGEHWKTLRGIFRQSDQCLEIDDPLAAILDRVHSRPDQVDEFDRYAVLRLASDDAEHATEGSLSRRISRTFAAYRARQHGEERWAQDRGVSAFRLVEAHSKDGDVSPMANEIAARLGLSVELVRRLESTLYKGTYQLPVHTSEWIAWFFHWLSTNTDLVEDAVDRKSLAELFGQRSYEACQTDGQRAELVLPVLEKLTRLWTQGHALRDLEIATGTEAGKLKTCLRARRFVVRIVPDLAYLFGLPALLDQTLEMASQPLTAALHAKKRLSLCTRFGFDTYEQVALKQLEPGLSRRKVHATFSGLQRYLMPTSEHETWEMVVARVEQARASAQSRS